MVSGINSFLSLTSLESIRDEIDSLPTENGEITEESQANLSIDSKNAISYLGSSKYSLGNKIEDLIAKYEAEKQTSKEVSPEMDMSLDFDENDISKPKSI